MPRAQLQVGDFVEPGAAGRALAQYHAILPTMVMRIEAVIPKQVYRRRAYSVVCGGERLVVWPSMIRKVKHPKKRKGKR